MAARVPPTPADRLTTDANGACLPSVPVRPRAADHTKRKTFKQTWMSKIVPREYTPTTGSVWSLKRYQYSYPGEIKVTPVMEDMALSKVD